MCLICVELVKGKLTAAEADRNLAELVMLYEDDPVPRHASEVLELIEMYKNMEKAATS
jgi:hypothetical protein